MDEEYRKREVSGTKEKRTGVKTIKDRFDDLGTENGSRNEIDGKENHVDSGVVWREDGEKREENILSCENVPHGGLFENQDVCSLHRDNQGAYKSEEEDKIDQETLELLEEFCMERFGNCQ